MLLSNICTNLICGYSCAFCASNVGPPPSWSQITPFKQNTFWLMKHVSANCTFIIMIHTNMSDVICIVGQKNVSQSMETYFLMYWSGTDAYCLRLTNRLNDDADAWQRCRKSMKDTRELVCVLCRRHIQFASINRTWIRTWSASTSAATPQPLYP